jgi:hypothetical protein
MLAIASSLRGAGTRSYSQAGKFLKYGSWKSKPDIGDKEVVVWLLSGEGCLWIPDKVADELVEITD